MIRKWMVLGVLLSFAGFAIFSLGCGQQQGDSATTTTTVATASAVVIKGATSSVSTGMSAKASTTFANAEVIIGLPIASSDAYTEIGRGTTDANGAYSINVNRDTLAGAAGESGYASNLILLVSKEGVTIGCMIPSVSPEAGRVTYAPNANPGQYAKQKMARRCFGKGIPPKNFDFNANIDQKFSSDTVKGYNDTQFDAVADSIKSGEDAGEEIALGLGISAANIQLMKNKGMELHKTYIEPIMQAAFENKTPPDRATMDAAFASMEAAMMAYAKELGITEQQLSDFKSMKDKTMETQMGQEDAMKNDPGFGEAKRRMMGTKITNLFLGQYDAANTVATIAPSGKTSYKDASGSSANYSKFVASKEVIVAKLNAMLNDATMVNPEQIPNYLRNNFFDAYVFPPAMNKPAPGEDMGQMMNSYANSRIMVYFMNTFLNDQQRMTYFASQESYMQPIFTNRFNNVDSLYYMGPNFWSTNPTPEQIQAKLALYNAALDAAMDNNAALKSIFIAAGFTDAQATTILKAFRILMSPPDMMG